MDDFEDATFLTAMSRALSVTTNKPKHLVDMLNEKLASVTPRRIINESIPVAAEAGSPRTRPISEPERPRPAEVKEGKKRNVTWRDSVGDSLCEEAWYPDTEEWGSRDETFAGFHENTSKGDEYEDDDDKESNSDEPDFPVHSTPRPKSPASNTSTSSTSPPAHAGLPLVQWSSGPTPIPRLRFTAISFLLTQRQASRMPPHPSVAQWRAGDGDPPMKLSYRIVGGTECQIVRATLVANGFKEAGPTQDDYNVMWANNKVDVHEIRSLNRYQKVNRFPRTNEITRKDKLYLNISRMKQTYGERHFDFLPPTFLLPQEYEPFYTCYLRTGGRWIVKPVASSQGRGIHVIDSLAELPSRLNADDKYLIQKYIDNPLLLNGYKFDLRIYVAITSFSPLRIYMFEEGLARVATERYDTNPIHSNRSCMHLTNSAINKQSENYVDNEDASQDDHGNKWSLTALMRYITSKYGSDNASLIKSKIKDIIVKSILSGEATVSTAVNMFVQHTGNCFELLGFDILIDENLTPWLLEINLSPSLACDTPLDLKIKSALIADLFTMVGMIPFQKGARRGTMQQPKPYRPPHGVTSPNVPKAEWTPSPSSDHKLTTEQQRIVRLIKDEHTRRGRFTRIFPTDASAYLYSSFLSKTSLNWTILIALFGKTSLAKPKRSESPTPRSYPAPRFNAVGAWSETSRLKPRVSSASPQTTTSNAPWAPGDESSTRSSLDTSYDYPDNPPSSRFFLQSDTAQTSLPSTEDILSGASELLAMATLKSSVPVRGPSVTSIKKPSENNKKVADKIQAREAFHVFLENILERLKRHYEQSDPDARMDENDIRQQVAVVDKFLSQARELALDTEQPHEPTTFDVEDMPGLTDRLEEFLKAYKRQTEKFKLDCLATGKISGTTNAWAPQSASASSSRVSSRPSSASKSGRTPNRSVTPSVNGEDYGIERPKQSPIRPVTIVPTHTQTLLQHHLAQAQAASTRSWASPAISSKVSSAFPVVYAWSPSTPAATTVQHHASPLAAAVTRKTKMRHQVAQDRNAVAKAKASRTPIGVQALSVQGAKYYAK